MNHRIATTFSAVLELLILNASMANADWSPGGAHKMHFPQLPESNGFSVEITYPYSKADDWRASETCPVNDIHFLFSARGDWFDLGQPIFPGQFYSVVLQINADLPAGSGGIPFSRPGQPLWRGYFVDPTHVQIRQYATGNQTWYSTDPTNVVPNDSQKIFECNVTGIPDPFYQKKDTVYWLAIWIFTAGQVGWVSSERSQYPSPSTGHYYQDRAVSYCSGVACPLNYPLGPNEGQGMDMAFVINGAVTVFDHKMHFQQSPDPTGADVNFSEPRVAADDWRCSESGPVDGIHFWFSPFGDWTFPGQPLKQQIHNVHLSIHDDVPADATNPYSHPGALLWERDIPALDPKVKFVGYDTGGQSWYDPSQGYVPANHIAMFRCDIDSIAQPFIQEEGHIYWLDVSMAADGLVGWKTADLSAYPAPYTGIHFQDDAVWAPSRLVPPPLPWQELTWPIGLPNGGQSIDLAFVITRMSPTGVGDSAPRSFGLEQNYPNPFNPTTTIRYTLMERSDVQLAVFGVDGRLVRVLTSGTEPEGSFEATWDGRDQSGRPVASGVYFYRMKAGAFVQTKKMVLLK